MDGTVDGGILRWGSHDEDCDLWTGQLAISSDQDTLAGTARVDATLCEEGTVVTGTMRLDRS